METLLERIKTADQGELNEIILASIRRFSQLQPGWSMCVLTVEEENREQMQQIREILSPGGYNPL